MSDSNFYSWPNYSDRDQRAFDFYKKATVRLSKFPLQEDIAICLCKSSGDLLCYVFVGGFHNDWKATTTFLEKAGCKINQMEDGNFISNRTVNVIPQNLAAAGFVPIACKARIAGGVKELVIMPKDLMPGISGEKKKWWQFWK